MDIIDEFMAFNPFVIIYLYLLDFESSFQINHPKRKIKANFTTTPVSTG